MTRAKTADPELSAKRSAAGSMGTPARVAKRRERRDAIYAARSEDRESEGEDLAAISAPEIASAIDTDGTPVPVPSSRVEDYPDRHAELQLAWGRYQAARERSIKVQVLRRELIAVTEVRAWCAARLAIVNRRLAAIATIPSATPEQVAWLSRWESDTREQIAKDAIA